MDLLEYLAREDDSISERFYKGLTHLSHFCKHPPKQVAVGDYHIWVAATWDIDATATRFDWLIPLASTLPEDMPLGHHLRILACPWNDGLGPPAGFGPFLHTQVIPLLARRKRVLVYCMGGHGRTGTFLASLIALLEPDCKDPIAEARERHCREAVETAEQAEAVFALRGQATPARYRRRKAWNKPKQSKLISK